LEIYNLAFNISGSVINESYPLLQTVSVSPRNVSFGSTPGSILSVTVNAVDNNKGIKYINVTIRGNGYPLLFLMSVGQKGITLQTLASLKSPNSTQYIAVFTINKDIKNVGSWNVDSIIICDEYNRLKTSSSADLNRDYDVDFTVNSIPETQSTRYFGKFFS
jgi:hypothetical protein